MPEFNTLDIGEDMSDPQKLIFDQLRDVRTIGLANLDNPKNDDAKSDLLELAATRIPDCPHKITKGRAVSLLLNYEIPRVVDLGHRQWLTILFGLSEENAGRSQSELRKMAAREAKDTIENFKRPGGREHQALQSLAAQIVADCLSVDETTDSDCDVGNASTRYRNRRYLIPVAGGLALVMALALVILWPESKESPSKSGSAAGTRASNDLEATLLRATTPINLSVAFSSSQKQTFEKLIAQAKQSADPLQADAVIAAGGFATELVATVEVEGKSDREVTIYNVRPTNVKRLPVVSAALMSSSGANPSTPVSMRFVLDEPSPQAREWAVGEPTDPRAALPFFQSQRLGVVKKQKQTIVMGFNAFWKSFEFTLTIYYEVGGQKYERTVAGDDSKPYVFRVSARACPRKPRSNWEAKLLTEQKDLQRYNEVWEMRPPDWKFQQITSAEYCARFSE